MYIGEVKAIKPTFPRDHNFCSFIWLKQIRLYICICLIEQINNVKTLLTLFALVS